MLLAAALLAACPAPSVAQSPSRCASLKAKATGARMVASLGCHAAAARKGTLVSYACLDGAAKPFARRFTKADLKGLCGMPGDAATIGDSVQAFAEGMAAALLPIGAPDAARRCAAKKMQRTGAFGRSRLACWARAFRDGLAPDDRCLGDATAKLERGFATAEAKLTCATLADESNVEQAVNGFVDAVASVLMLPSTSTTIAAGTSTTTTDPGGGTTTTVMGGSTTSSSSTSSSTTTSSTIVPGLVTFSADVQPIFTAQCATTGCHAGPVPAQGLDLAAGSSHAALVNVSSGECPLFKLVLPTKPDQSYLVFKLTGPPQPCFSGNQMPSGGTTPLSAAEQSTIRAWITQGALND